MTPELPRFKTQTMTKWNYIIHCDHMNIFPPAPSIPSSQSWTCILSVAEHHCKGCWEPTTKKSGCQGNRGGDTQQEQPTICEEDLPVTNWSECWQRPRHHCGVCQGWRREGRHGKISHVDCFCLFSCVTAACLCCRKYSLLLISHQNTAVNVCYCMTSCICEI